jgi:amino acid adenylation domain-containing protein
VQINVLEYLEQGALARFPDRPAVLDGGRVCTFAQLAARARRCASLLLRRTEAVNRPVAVFLPKSIETVVADLGILATGNAYTNLDVKSPAPRLRALLGNVDPACYVTSRAHLPALSALGVEPGRVVLVEDFDDEKAAVDEAALARRRAEVIDTDPACIISTSGSTGVPKSVVMHHRAVIDFIDWVLATFAFDEHDVFGSLSPFYFDIYTLELFVALARGCAIDLIPEGHAAFPVRLVEFLAQRGVSFIFWVPSIMVHVAGLDLLRGVDLSRLRKVFFAGEVFPTRQFNYWRQHLPSATFVNLYGPIEITVDCTYYVVDREFDDAEPLPIGFPRRNAGVLILNDRDEAAAVNEPGELCVRGSALACGYWNSPERTAAAFAQNPLNKAYPELIYRTGDLARRNERGEIIFMGRRDYQVKHLGYRIELGEIETAVGAITEVQAACVLYHAGRKEITLFYAAPEAVTPAFLRARLAQALPKYMLPTAFHRLEALPRNPNGKIDRQLLTTTYLSEAP